DRVAQRVRQERVLLLPEKTRAHVLRPRLAPQRHDLGLGAVTWLASQDLWRAASDKRGQAGRARDLRPGSGPMHWLVRDRWPRFDTFRLALHQTYPGPQLRTWAADRRDP